MTADTSPPAAMLSEIHAALGAEPAEPGEVIFVGQGDLPSCFAVSDLAAASVAAAALGVARLAGVGAAEVDRRLASLWFRMSFAPQGWDLPPVWDAVAGDYPAADGWIRLHTNAPHHRDAALRVLGVAPDKAAVARAVERWQAEDLEAAVVAEGGCAAAMRSAAEWAAHPQGRAVAAEPLIWRESVPGTVGHVPQGTPERPLAGLRVLDLTRILAGPVATRFLAGFGAEVLRIDPPDWQEPTLEAEITPGKTCARLDLKSAEGRDRFLDLLAGADVLVHGYRSDALAGLGLGPEVRAAHCPGLVDVSLDAYGWTGPLAARRGFDSLVQMSTGLAAAGMAASGADRPAPLPVQALDHATGYMMAAAAVQGLRLRGRTGQGSRMRLSLARTAAMLSGHGPRVLATGNGAIGSAGPADFAPALESTALGPGKRLIPPVRLARAAMQWDVPAGRLGASAPEWASQRMVQG